MTFPQNVNERAQIFHEVNVVRVRKHGREESLKGFRVQRYCVQKALVWLKDHNAAYSDIIIGMDRLNFLPVDGQLEEITTLEVPAHTAHVDDLGPAREQLGPDVPKGTNVVKHPQCGG